MTCESDKGNVALSQSPNVYRGHLVTRDYAPATMPWHNGQAMKLQEPSSEVFKAPSSSHPLIFSSKFSRVLCETLDTLNMVMDMDEVVTLDILSSSGASAKDV
ncbi:hypothetical protein L6452_21369 [Arctium lappa]|uniref:Uncharacterized protein n=1 Tax=Arctium lappa TaxID=4217 RepID=A0ACB9BF78_ARCLA|nr:hypothetical protein L6452_21369 [Arctium lappa]